MPIYTTEPVDPLDDPFTTELLVRVQRIPLFRIPHNKTIEDSIAKSGWRRTCFIGRLREFHAAKLLGDEYKCTFSFQPDYRSGAWDLKAPHNSKTVEVKDDVRAAETGNVAIEVACAGNPSGITTSTADYWFFFADDEAHLIETSQLRELCKTAPKRTGGDGGRSTFHLVKLQELKRNAIVTLPAKRWNYEKMEAAELLDEMANAVDALPVITMLAA